MRTGRRRHSHWLGHCLCVQPAQRQRLEKSRDYSPHRWRQQCWEDLTRNCGGGREGAWDQVLRDRCRHQWNCARAGRRPEYREDCARQFWACIFAKPARGIQRRGIKKSRADRHWKILPRRRHEVVEEHLRRDRQVGKIDGRAYAIPAVSRFVSVVSHGGIRIARLANRIVANRMEEAAMSFGAPLWFWALAILPVLIVLFVWNEKRRKHLLQKIVAERLRDALAGNVSTGKRRLRFLLLLAGLACVIASLAEPRYGYVWEQSKRKGRDIIIAI